MRLTETGEVIIRSAEQDGCIYDLSRPEEDIALGAVLELVDFHNSAKCVGTTVAVGTRVFKEVIQHMTDYWDNGRHNEALNPFANVWRLSGNPRGLTIYQIPTITLALQNYYIEAQALKDFYDVLTDVERHIKFAHRGTQVVEDVLYDTGDFDEMFTEPLR